jgi:8-oxo-dGTP diphosphatase
MSDHVVRAAGGILLRRDTSGGVEIAVVHRPKYGDWTLPKGKLDPGETDEGAAVREVAEETGFRVAILAPAGTTRYRDSQGRPKEARYWYMFVAGGEFTPNDEVDELRWLSVDEAMRVLTYERDRQLVAGVAENTPI